MILVFRKALLYSYPLFSWVKPKTSIENCRIGLVIEAAGQDALRMYGRQTLVQGLDLLATSIGVFTDENFFGELIQAAETSGARLLLASGALPAVDWMAAASLAGVESVSITQAKPVASWHGTPAAHMIDLDSLKETTCFFKGTAREAASQFPKSSNITAMLALATSGLDKTRVKLVADPTSFQMYTLIEFDGPAGSLRIEWSGVPSEKNPSTSADVPLTVVKAVRNLTSSVWYGP
jgi:aspartate dehydrogenase